jgi:YggT family protein
MTADDIAGFLSALITVYSLIIVAYIISSLIFSFGVRMPYNRVLNAVFNFLRDVSEPYLRPFRRIIPQIGPLDISPIVAILVLQIGGGIIVSLIANAG